MSENTMNPGDDRLGDLLRQAAAAPARRDAMFRIRVMEARERDRYRRRFLLTAGAGLAAAGITLAGLLAGGDVRSGAAMALAILALASAGLTLAGGRARQLRLSGI